MGHEIDAVADSEQRQIDLAKALETLEWARSELRKPIQRPVGVPVQKLVYKHIWDVASNRKLLKLQKEVLKCYVGGFIFINPDKQDVFPVFGASELTAGEAAYPLRYVWSSQKVEKNKKYMVALEQIIDHMFLCWRLAETIRPTDDKRWHPPEYLYDLPIINFPESQFLMIHPNEQQLHPIERSLRAKFGCHYCSIGETTFYMYAWRLFLRLIWLYGPSATFPNDDVKILAKSEPNTGYSSNYIWDSKVWTDHNSRERQWVNYIHEHNLEENEAWQRGTQELQEKGVLQEPWRSDWEAMLLVDWIDQTKAIRGKTIKPLLRYAEFVAEKLGDRKVSKKLHDYHKYIISERGTELTIDQVCLIDSLLKKVVYKYFVRYTSTSSSLECNVVSLLKILHATVRFPVLPYFYWIAADRNPRAHLVIPVWTSNIDTVNLPVIAPNLVDEEIKPSETTVNTGVMGVAVLGVHPLENLDWTWQDSRPTECYDRLALLRQYYDMFAAYIADDWFYMRSMQRDIRRIANLSHDLKNPITQIKLYSEVLINGVKDIDEQRRYLEIIDDEISRFQAMTENLFYVSKVESSKIVIMKEQFAIQNIITDSLKLHRLMAEGKNIRIEIDLPECPLNILGDPHLLRRAIDNLIHNAIKYNYEAGKIKIALYEDTENVILFIEDTGPGIADEDKPRIFERFFQKNIPNISAKGGTGLGLFATKDIIEKHDGNISFKSKVGEGTVFRIVLPKQGGKEI